MNLSQNFLKGLSQSDNFFRRNSTSLKTLLGVLLLFIVLIGWSVSSPPGASPDDDYHIASSYCALGERTGLCESTENISTREIPSGIVSVHNCYSVPSKSATCLTNHFRSSEGKMDYSSRVNVNDFYPKLFYFTNGLFASADIQKTVFLTRFFNIAVVIFLFFIAYRYCNPRIREVIPITIALSSVPLGMFIFSSNNPSSWAVASLLAYSLLLASITTPLVSRTNLRLLIPILTCLIAALGSRPDSALMIPIITAGIFLYIFDGVRISARMWLAGTAIALGTALLLWWRNSSLREFVLDGFLGESIPIPGIDIFISNFLSLPQFVLGSFGVSFAEVPTRTGHLGWFNTPVPPITGFITFSVYIIFLCLSFPTWRRSQKKALGFFIPAFVALPLLIHQRDKTVIGQDVQPRYFLVFVFLVFGFSLVRKRFHTITMHMRLFFVFTISLAHSSALFVALKRYAVGYGDFGWSLNSDNGWQFFSSLSPNAIWMTTSVSYACFSYLAIMNLCDSNLTSPSVESKSVSTIG